MLVCDERLRQLRWRPPGDDKFGSLKMGESEQPLEVLVEQAVEPHVEYDGGVRKHERRDAGRGVSRWLDLQKYGPVAV